MVAHDRPAWQRDPIFQFLASLRLAMILLFTLIVACVFGTLYETDFSAKVARHYVYDARWFNAWLVLLAVNLACVALSRWPWKKHHTAFLIAHLGIIILLAGSLIGRIWGIEGTLTLRKGEAPNHVLTVDERILEITEPGPRYRAVNAEVFKKLPTPEKPRHLTETADGWRIDLTGYSNLVEVALDPKPADREGLPAIELQLETAMMSQRLGGWLMAGSERHGTLDLGLAKIDFKRGTAPAIAKADPAPAGPAPVRVEEVIFAFGKVADQVSRSIVGGSTGAKLALEHGDRAGQGTVVLRYADREHRFDLSSSLGKTLPLEGTALELYVEAYWPDFRIRDGKPESVTAEPHNPAVQVRVRGEAVPLAEEHGEAEQPNALTIYASDSGDLSFHLRSRRLGETSGPLKVGDPLLTGWADWKVTAVSFMPRAMPGFKAAPAESRRMGNFRYTEGIRVTATKNGTTLDEWLPLGWQIGLPTGDEPLKLIYGYRQAALPIALRLLDFEVQRDEGTETPASFKSTIEVSTPTGKKATGSAWMNHPFSFPSGLLHTWTGLTYKISQASWNPDNLGESTVQILRDPGWSLKWIGSLLLTFGIFALFYIPSFRRKPGRKPGRRPESVPKPTQPVP